MGIGFQKRGQIRQPHFSEGVRPRPITSRWPLAGKAWIVVNPTSRSFAKTAARCCRFLAQSGFAVIHVVPDLPVRDVSAGHAIRPPAIARGRRGQIITNRPS